jgi:hypothetical protein
MSHASDETGEEEAANLVEPKMDGGIKWSVEMVADDEQEHQEIARTKSLKWLRLGQEDGEKSIYARTCSPGWWFKPWLHVGF